MSTLDKAMRDKLSALEVKLLESHDLMEVRGKVSNWHLYRSIMPIKFVMKCICELLISLMALR